MDTVITPSSTRDIKHTHKRTNPEQHLERKESKTERHERTERSRLQVELIIDEICSKDIIITDDIIINVTFNITRGGRVNLRRPSLT